jgi:hypothetical protein
MYPLFYVNFPYTIKNVDVGEAGMGSSSSAMLYRPGNHSQIFSSGALSKPFSIPCTSHGDPNPGMHELEALYLYPYQFLV